jgi:fluoroacetyl-CoA thioesterase
MAVIKLHPHRRATQEETMILKARTAEASLRMSAPDTAEATCLSPEDTFPAVLETSRMTGLMELAAVRLMKQNLRDGESSVGIAMNVTHAAYSTVSGTVRAVATYAGVAGRLHRFEINVFDESGLIGSAKHTRAVVVERRLLAVARRRAGLESMLLMV